jgi:hypothetical protein
MPGTIVETDCYLILKKHKDSPKSRDVKSSTKLCKELLTTAANKTNPSDTKQLFKILHQYNYCDISNVVLGPLVKSFIIR